MTIEQVTEVIVKALDDKKADDIKVLEIGALTTIGDRFIVASGNNTTLVKALAGEVEEKMDKLGRMPRRIEGYGSSNWILMDYEDIIVHIFLEETREFYGLERLWTDAKQLDLSDILKK